MQAEELKLDGATIRDWKARAEAAEGPLKRLLLLPGEMRDRACAYHPKEMRRGAAAHQELQEWARAIDAAIEGGEEWESVYKPRSFGGEGE